MEFPRFDLSKFENASGAERRQLSVALDTICSETGFVILEGHGVPEEMIERQWSVINDFFAAPSGVKEKVKVPYSGYPYGWIGPDQEALAASKGELTPPDLKESCNGGPLVVPEQIQDRSAYDFCYQPTLWPDVGDFQDVWS